MARLVWKVSAICCTVYFSLSYIWRAMRTWAVVRVARRPPVRPRARAEARPSWVQVLERAGGAGVVERLVEFGATDELAGGLVDGPQWCS
ncbi:hypothetical protein GCM10020000_77760 [Streptomyces olivoverticillatus]